MLASNHNLRIVANFAVGYNNVDVEAARELGIIVTNTPGVLTEATADLTIALILAITRRIIEGDREVRTTGRCEWEPLKLLGASLQGKRLGIIGMGRIGSAVARRATAFGLDVIHASRERGTPLGELLETSDIVSLHTPLTEATRHIINREALSRMKRGAYIVNTSRGALIDEKRCATRSSPANSAARRWTSTNREPVVNRRLLSMDNVVIVPHIGSATEEARTAMAKKRGDGRLSAFWKGQQLLHRVL